MVADVRKSGREEENSNNVEGSVSELPDGQEAKSYVPVDPGVFAYILKVFGSNIRRLESRYNVKIEAEDDSVNQSSAVRITSAGRLKESEIREAKKAVVDLYSTVFSTLSLHVFQLQELAISSEELTRIIITYVEKLYKEVLVKVSGEQLMIYGTLEALDVKVVKALISNRVYDATRRVTDSYHESQDDDLLVEGSASSTQGMVDTIANASIESQVEEGQNIEGREENQDRDFSPWKSKRAQKSDRGHIVTSQIQMPLKFRLKHDKLTYNTSEGLKVRVYQGDITKEKIGTIVNAANESLVHGGGVAGAISRAAGSTMMVDCTRYIAKHGMLYPGQVMWTSGGNLLCQFVIHAVGPRWGEYKNKAECDETLRMTFLRCLEVAEKELMVAAIAMPIISSGECWVYVLFSFSTFERFLG